jgi:putative redox protein
MGGGGGSAPTPFWLFLASLGTCAGIYVLGFCRQRGLPTDGIRLVRRVERDPATHMVSSVALETP